MSEIDWARLDRSQVLTRVLSGKGGQVALFVATRLNATPEALVACTRAIAERKRSKFVLAISRFSDPPRVSDRETLALDERDLEAIGRCAPGECGLKLTDITALTSVQAATGAESRDVLRREFRRLLVARRAVPRSGPVRAGTGRRWKEAEKAGRRAVSVRAVTVPRGADNLGAKESHQRTTPP